MKPTVPDVLPLVRAYCSKPGNSQGGALHIVLADQNVQNCHVAACLQGADESGDTEGADLARLLLAMTRTQRLKLQAGLR